MDEHLHAGKEVPEVSGGPAGQTVRLPGRRYGEEAAADHLQPLTAIVPKRIVTLILLLIGGLLLTAGIQASYGYVQRLPADHWLRATASLDVERPGSLASWSSSLFLLTATVLGFQIYRLRRHRADDYRGRYRVWVWVSPLLLIASLAVGTHLHHDLLCGAVAHSEVMAVFEPRTVLMVLPSVLWLLVALRLLLEVRDSRAAWTSLVLASLSLLSSLVIGLWVPYELFSFPIALTISSLTMLGHLMMLMTVASYSRYVYLDAHGLLPEAKATRRRNAKTAAEKTQRPKADKASRLKKGVPAKEEAAASSEPPAQAVPLERISDAVAFDTDEDDRLQASDNEPTVSRKDFESAAEGSQPSDNLDGLSKSERRRQKKLKRRESTRRAA
jgi:hypothetical protein